MGCLHHLNNIAHFRNLQQSSHLCKPKVKFAQRKAKKSDSNCQCKFNAQLNHHSGFDQDDWRLGHPN